MEFSIVVHSPKLVEPMIVRMHQRVGPGDPFAYTRQMLMYKCLWWAMRIGGIDIDPRDLPNLEEES